MERMAGGSRVSGRKPDKDRGIPAVLGNLDQGFLGEFQQCQEVHNHDSNAFGNIEQA